MRSSTRWFVIGFGVRLTLGVLVMVASLSDPDASMWLFFDPTMFWIYLLHDWLAAGRSHLDPSHPLYHFFNVLFGGHPIYPLINLVGSTLWGLIFMTGARLLTALRSKRRSGNRILINENVGEQ